MNVRLPYKFWFWRIKDPTGFHVEKYGWRGWRVDYSWVGRVRFYEGGAVAYRGQCGRPVHLRRWR